MNDVNRIRDLMYQTCKRHGTPAYPAQLLNAIMNRLAANNFAKVFVARLQEKIVAALVLFTMSKEGIYAYNFSDEKYLDSYPNNALLWAAIKWSMDNELRLFDMGISSPHDKELFAFKMRWGATAAKLHDYFIGANEQLVSAPDRRSSRKYASATTIWKLIPGLLANRLGPRLIRHLE
jgi:lipid II:glycine glycyltransferase (peptidoglycan interpeptide bridge formation enzyme)